MKPRRRKNLKRVSRGGKTDLVGMSMRYLTMISVGLGRAGLMKTRLFGRGIGESNYLKRHVYRVLRRHLGVHRTISIFVQDYREKLRMFENSVYSFTPLELLAFQKYVKSRVVHIAKSSYSLYNNMSVLSGSNKK